MWLHSHGGRFTDRLHFDRDPIQAVSFPSRLKQLWRTFWNWRPFLPPTQQRRLDLYDMLPRHALVLDLGCGDGWITSRWQGPVIGVEYSWGLCHQSRARGLAVVQADALHLPFREGAFEACISLYVLDHTPDNRVVCQEVGRVLKPGGCFLALLPALVGSSLFDQKLAQQYHESGHTHYPEHEMRRWMEQSPLQLTTLVRVPGFVANLADALDMMAYEYSARATQRLLGDKWRPAWRVVCRLVQLITGPVYFVCRARPPWGRNSTNVRQNYSIDWVFVARRVDER